MITQEQIPTVLDHPVQDIDGNKIGDAKHVFLDDVTGQPEWVSVKTGLFGTSESFVPTHEATLVEDHLEVPYAKDTVKDAPNVDVDAGGHLSEEEEHRLYEHYGIDWDEAWQQANQAGQGAWAQPGQGGWAHPDTGMGGQPPDTAAFADTEAAGTALDYDDTTASGIARSGKEHAETTAAQSDYDDSTASGIARSGKERPDTVSADSDSSGDDEATTRPEEQMRAGTERRETGRPRLRKYVVTEQQTVPVRREEVRMEREPTTDANVDQAKSGPDNPEA
ncbi:DUF2382 domain-containing protein [Streptomyces sp. NPDC002889]|uniref:DUF2382 domain-containing protein n=1 Tax=Streptomyces sp. NPDC002889 TaxID=3364669 RepID=UPI00367615CF